jgi:uncharacterized protein
MRRILLLCLFILAAPASPAADPLDLYSGESVVADQGAAERARALPLALEQVLSKLSGLPQFADRPLVEPALGRAPSIVLSYFYRNVTLRRADGGEAAELRLVARFAQPEVDELARALQLPLWRPERPALVAWLIIDEDGERRVLPLEFMDIMESMSDVAAGRGLVLERPQPGPEGEYGVDPAVLWGGYTEDLATPGGKGVMIAAARREGPQWGVRINLGYQGQHLAWRLEDIDLQAALTAAVHQAVDQIAAANAIAAGDLGSWQQEVTVDGLHRAEDYQRLLAYLQGLSVVEGVSVVSARPTAVTFRLELGALPKYFEEAVAAGGVVEWVESESQYRLRETDHDEG